mmetsp:Transcript_22511/g.25028  ORF Transcript_22511/g.25028 Transcript_22511/m.25028 type:complete len:190 (-) Transcript_22511:72-641(-)
MNRENQNFCEAFKNGFLILIFEFGGSIMLACFLRMLSAIQFTFGYWFIVAICHNITGSHFNPIVTLSFMFRRDNGKMKINLGIWYIIVQILGCIVGCLLAYMLLENGGSLRFENDEYSFQAAFSETLGSFLYVFVFLIHTGAETKFSNDPAIWSFILAATYGSVTHYNSSKISASINPAYALGVYITRL